MWGVVDIGGVAGKTRSVAKIVGVAVHLPAGIASEIELVGDRFAQLRADASFERFVVVGPRDEQRRAVRSTAGGIENGYAAVNTLLAPSRAPALKYANALSARSYSTASAPKTSRSSV